MDYEYKSPISSFRSTITTASSHTLQRVQSTVQYRSIRTTCTGTLHSHYTAINMKRGAPLAQHQRGQTKFPVISPHPDDAVESLEAGEYDKTAKATHTSSYYSIASGGLLKVLFLIGLFGNLFVVHHLVTLQPPTPGKNDIHKSNFPPNFPIHHHGRTEGGIQLSQHASDMATKTFWHTIGSMPYPMGTPLFIRMILVTCGCEIRPHKFILYYHLPRLLPFCKMTSGWTEL